MTLKVRMLKAGDKLKHSNGSTGVVESVGEKKEWAIVRWADGNREAWSNAGLANGGVVKLGAPRKTKPAPAKAKADAREAT